MTQTQLDGPQRCKAPCWPVCCDECPFGNIETTLEQVQEMIEKW